MREGVCEGSSALSPSASPASSRRWRSCGRGRTAARRRPPTTWPSAAPAAPAATRGLREGGGGDSRCAGAEIGGPQCMATRDKRKRGADPGPGAGSAVPPTPQGWSPEAKGGGAPGPPTQSPQKYRDTGSVVSPALAGRGCIWRAGRGPARLWRDRTPVFPKENVLGHARPAIYAHRPASAGETTLPVRKRQRTRAGRGQCRSPGPEAPGPRGGRLRRPALRDEGLRARERVWLWERLETRARWARTLTTVVTPGDPVSSPGPVSAPVSVQSDLGSVWIDPVRSGSMRSGPPSVRSWSGTVRCSLGLVLGSAGGTADTTMVGRPLPAGLGWTRLVLGSESDLQKTPLLVGYRRENAKETDTGLRGAGLHRIPEIHLPVISRGLAAGHRARGSAAWAGGDCGRAFVATRDACEPVGDGCRQGQLGAMIVSGSVVLHSTRVEVVGEIRAHHHRVPVSFQMKPSRDTKTRFPPTMRQELPEWYAEIFVDKLDYSLLPSVSFARLERACAAVRRNTKPPWSFAPLWGKPASLHLAPPPPPAPRALCSPRDHATRHDGGAVLRGAAAPAARRRAGTICGARGVPRCTRAPPYPTNPGEMEPIHWHHECITGASECITGASECITGGSECITCASECITGASECQWVGSISRGNPHSPPQRGGVPPAAPHRQQWEFGCFGDCWLLFRESSEIYLGFGNFGRRVRRWNARRSEDFVFPAPHQALALM
eukprot:gene8416-biopygen16626